MTHKHTLQRCVCVIHKPLVWLGNTVCVWRVISSRLCEDPKTLHQKPTPSPPANNSSVCLRWGSRVTLMCVCPRADVYSYLHVSGFMICGLEYSVDACESLTDITGHSYVFHTSTITNWLIDWKHPGNHPDQRSIVLLRSQPNEFVVFGNTL